MTPLPTTSTPAPVHTYTAKARRHKDGSVLLSIADDRICKLNGVGALTWMILEESPAGQTIGEVVKRDPHAEILRTSERNFYCTTRTPAGAPDSMLSLDGTPALGQKRGAKASRGPRIKLGPACDPAGGTPRRTADGLKTTA